MFGDTGLTITVAADAATIEGLMNAVTFHPPTSAAELSAEAAIFWRVRCQWLKANKVRRSCCHGR